MPEQRPANGDDKRVQLPGDVVARDDKSLSTPLQQLLRDLGLLETTADAEKGVSLRGTPDSLQVIRAGALSVSKGWTAFTATAGGAGAVSTLIAAWKSSPGDQRLVLIGGASVILAATAIAIAMIVRGDLGARAATSAELYRARARISSAFIQAAVAATGRGSAQPSALAGDTLQQLLAAVNVAVPNENASSGLYGVRKRAGHHGLEIRRSDGDWVRVTAVPDFELELPIPAQPSSD
jgi:hypothetical protein